MGNKYDKIRAQLNYLENGAYNLIDIISETRYKINNDQFDEEAGEKSVKSLSGSLEYLEKKISAIDEILNSKE